MYPKECYGFDRFVYIDFAVGGHVEDNASPLEGFYRKSREEPSLTKNQTSNLD